MKIIFKIMEIYMRIMVLMLCIISLFFLIPVLTINDYKS